MSFSSDTQSTLRSHHFRWWICDVNGPFAIVGGRYFDGGKRTHNSSDDANEYELLTVILEVNSSAAVMVISERL